MSVELTVIVKSTGNNLVEGATVSVTPGDVTGKTDSDGEATLTIDGANRYQVTVTHEGTTETVPYYAVEDQTSARLEVNLEYLQQQQTQQETVATPTATSEASSMSWMFIGAGVILVVVIVIFAVNAQFLRKKRL